MFNKYEFLANLMETILEEVKIDNLGPDNDVYVIIYNEIDRECIYTYDSFEICKELGFVNWEDSDLPVNNICQAAYSALSECVNEELDFKLIDMAIQERDEARINA